MLEYGGDLREQRQEGMGDEVRGWGSEGVRG